MLRTGLHLSVWFVYSFFSILLSSPSIISICVRILAGAVSLERAWSLERSWSLERAWSLGRARLGPSKGLGPSEGLVCSLKGIGPSKGLGPLKLLGPSKGPGPSKWYGPLKGFGLPKTYLLLQFLSYHPETFRICSRDHLVDICRTELLFRSLKSCMGF